MQLDIPQALAFLDMLEPQGRHTIASEAPFGNNGNPRWEGGATYEYQQRNHLVFDIKERQARGSNVYYSVNTPCPIGSRTGLFGKNNIDDIIAIRALAFDIDFTTAKSVELVSAMMNFIELDLKDDLRPSVVISTGGGYQLIYILESEIDIKLRRPVKHDSDKAVNDIFIAKRSAITSLAHDIEAHLRKIIPEGLPIKIDNMSNVDRVMRLPGTINYPEAEKIAKGQVPALAQIAANYNRRTDIRKLRAQIEPLQPKHGKLKTKIPFIPHKDSAWPPAKKAIACCEFIMKQGLADTNEWYTLNVMLPLIGAIHDADDNNRITEAEAEECFMLAVSGGVRYGSVGRGPGYFERQWRSHGPHLARNGTKSLGGLIFAAESNGFELPWRGVWMSEKEHMIEEEFKKNRSSTDEDTAAMLKDYQ